MANVITRLFSSKTDKKKDVVPDTDEFEEEDSFDPNKKKHISVNTSFITNPSAEYMLSEKEKKLNLLTQRETDVFSLLLKGMSMKDIAEKLGIKYPTVNTHMNAVYRKLGVSSKSQLILEYHEYL